MSAMNNYFIEHAHEFTDCELRRMGYSEDDIADIREWAPKPFYCNCESNIEERS